MEEKEYLEREALMNIMINGLFPNKKIETEFDVLRAIEKAPAADVQEVRHGYKGESTFSSTGFLCSVCHSNIDRDAVFCKYCGAKMDLQFCSDIGCVPPYGGKSDCELYKRGYCVASMKSVNGDCEVTDK